MATPAPLIIHLDVNKTLICSDVAGGKSMDDVLNEMVRVGYP
jgi:hypothetical protein